MPNFFDGPIFSIILCLLAGVALRYALFGSSPERPESVPERDAMATTSQSAGEHRQRETAERLLALQGALEAAHQREARLQLELDRWREQQEQDRSVVQDTCVVSSVDLNDLERELLFALEEQARYRASLQAAMEHSAAARQQCESLLLQNDDLQTRIALLEEEITRTERTGAEHSHVREQQVSQLSHEVAEIIEERDALRHQAESHAEAMHTLRQDLLHWQQRSVESKHRLEELQQRARGLEATHQQWQIRCEDLTTERDELIRGLQRERREREELAQRQSAQLEEIDRLRKSHLELMDLRTRWSESCSQLQVAQQQLQQYTADRDQLGSLLSQSRQRIADLENDVATLSERMARQDAMLRELRMEKEEALTHLERERNERSLLASQLAAQLETLERLRTDSQQLESLLEKQTAVHVSLHEHTERLRQAARSLDRGGKSDGPQILSFAPTGVSPPLDDLASQDPLRGWIYRQPPPRCDDLRRISGIGEILEARLHDLGVYTYAQIMQWQANHVHEFSKLLAFRDRIEREQWVAQAKRLHLELYGEAA